MLYFVVGPMGVGKNYVGERLAERLGCDFVDGDSFIPPAMAEKIAGFKALGKDDVDDFVTNHLIPQVAEHSGQNKDLVIAQALYRIISRQQIERHFGRGQCVFVGVRASLFTNLKRLFSRERGLKWAAYGLLNRPFFQDWGDIIWVSNAGNEKHLNADLYFLGNRKIDF